MGERTLAGEVARLHIVSWHACGDDFCHSFDTQPRSEMRADAVSRSVELPQSGVADLVVVDVVDDRIWHVEVVMLGDG
jgi:hypothetical protein